MHFLKNIAVILFLAPFVFINAEVEEVVVTANKKEETVQEIPMNISVITDEIFNLILFLVAIF